MMLFSVKTVITNHVKELVGYMDNDFFNELEHRDGLFDVLVVLMAVVTESDKAVFILKDALFSNRRSAYITEHVVNNGRRVGKFSIGIDIKAVIFLNVKLVGKCL